MASFVAYSLLQTADSILDEVKICIFLQTIQYTCIIIAYRSANVHYYSLLRILTNQQPKHQSTETAIIVL